MAGKELIIRKEGRAISANCLAESAVRGTSEGGGETGESQGGMKGEGNGKKEDGEEWCSWGSKEI